MSTIQHDPAKFADSLGSKLSARSRHVCVFLGAGASKACGLPDVATLQELVVAGLNAGQQTAFDKQRKGRTFEEALSRVRRIETLLRDASGKVDGLNAGAAAALDRDVCRLIVKHLQEAKVELEPMLRFVAWAAQAEYDQPLELFTVNYDLLLETALEEFGIPYFDGFVGTLRARFRTDLVEASPQDAGDWLPAFLVRLWKLHGSVNWEWEAGERAEVVRLGASVPSGSPAAIYPSDMKYEESQRVPFVVLQDRFRRALQTPETLVLVTGYSWGDGHLNEMLFDAAKRRPRTELVSFSFGPLPEPLATRAEALPNIQVVGTNEAVLAGVRGGWAAPASELPNIWADGQCLLGDFRHLSRLLARSSPQHGDVDQRLTELLDKLGGAGA
jgi:hypothetical protein